MYWMWGHSKQIQCKWDKHTTGSIEAAFTDAFIATSLCQRAANDHWRSQVRNLCRLPWDCLCCDAWSLLPGQRSWLDSWAGSGQCLPLRGQLQPVVGSQGQKARGQCLLSGSMISLYPVLYRLKTLHCKVRVLGPQRAILVYHERLPMLSGKPRQKGLAAVLSKPVIVMWSAGSRKLWAEDCFCRLNLRRRLVWEKPSMRSLNGCAAMPRVSRKRAKLDCVPLMSSLSRSGLLLDTSQAFKRNRFSQEG